MSDEQPLPVPAKKSSLMSTLIWLGIAVMTAVLGALLLYLLVLRPMLAEPGTGVAEGELYDKLNPDAITVDFEESVASVRMPPDSPLPAALLSFAVSLECNNRATAELVQRHQARFTDMINRQHEFRERAELDDPSVKVAIQQTILLEANTILKQLQPGAPDPSIRVTDVFHRRFLISDQL